MRGSGEFADWRRDARAIADERGVALKECCQRRRLRQVPRIRRVVLPPMGRMRPNEIGIPSLRASCGNFKHQ